MMAGKGFDTMVAARTTVATQILETSELLQGFVTLGGLARDLTGIKSTGEKAAAAHLGRSLTGAAGKGATVEVLAKLNEVLMEYSSVMAVLQAVHSELKRNGSTAELLAKIQGILDNEVQTTATTYVEGDKKKRKVRKSGSQKAIVDEIAKDAAAMVELTEIHPALAERQVPPARLEALKTGAGKVSGLMGARAKAKGAGKGATKAEHDAVAQQRDYWSGTSRILTALGRRDERVRTLLAETRR
jgi:hypothetical protein